MSKAELTGKINIPKEEFPNFFKTLEETDGLSGITEQQFGYIEEFYNSEFFNGVQINLEGNDENFEYLQYFCGKIDQIKRNDYVPEIQDIMNINYDVFLKEIQFTNRGLFFLFFYFFLFFIFLFI